jgi:hypothetical protein
VLVTRSDGYARLEISGTNPCMAIINQRDEGAIAHEYVGDRGTNNWVPRESEVHS